jgi:hypothetical protein
LIEPGCFGIPSIFSFKSDVCNNCEHQSRCQAQSQNTLLSIKESMFVTDILNEHLKHSVAVGNTIVPSSVTLDIKKPIPFNGRSKKVRYALTIEQIEILKTLPKKVGAFLNTVWSKGEHLRLISVAQSGRNPFDAEKNRPYQLAYSMMMYEGRATRANLVDTIMDSFDWSYASAYSQVSLMWRALPILGLCIINGDFIELMYPSKEFQNSTNKLKDRASN